MKILALCKYSRDVAELRVDRASRALLLDGVPRRIGGIDKNVVEAAVQLKEAAGGTVEALCFGPLVAKESFKDVLAMGVDEMTLVEDAFDGSAQAESVATILAKAIGLRGPFDAVLCGFASDDGYTFQVGPRLAERLGLPIVSYARRARPVDGQLEVERDLEDRWQTVRVPLPAVITIAEEAFPPRRTTLMDALKARQKPVNVWHLDEELGLSAEALRAGERVAPSVEVGIVVERRQQLLKAAPIDDLADSFIDALVELGALEESRS